MSGVPIVAVKIEHYCFNHSERAPFNEAVTPFAEQFGMTIANMGTASAVAGAIGRTASPLAGAAIVCAGIAGVSPLELAKRTMPAMIVALIVLMMMLFL